MVYSDFTTPGPLIAAFSILLGAAVTIHAARAGSLSRGWAAAWLMIFMGLAGWSLWSGARDASERRQAAEHQKNREQIEDQNWAALLANKQQSAPDKQGTPQGGVGVKKEIRTLSDAEQSKMAVLLRAMGPYKAELYYAPNPYSEELAKQFEGIFRAAGWSASMIGAMEGSIGYSVLSRPEAPPGMKVLNADPAAFSKMQALVGLLWEFRLPAGGGWVEEVPKDTLVVAVGEPPSGRATVRWYYPPLPLGPVR